MFSSNADDARGKTRVLRVGGVDVHTVEWRPPQPVDDRRVLLLHGLGAHTLSWEPIALPLADRLHAVVTAVDLAGFGRTRAPSDATSLDAQCRLVIGLLDELGPALVVGNSMGATIGVGVTAKRPDRVDGLVLVNPAVPHPRPGVADWLRIAWLAPIAVPALGAGIVALRARALGPERLVDGSLQSCVTRTESVDPELRQRMVDLTAERLTWPEAPAAYADAARSLVFYMARGLHRDLAEASARRPVLLMHGVDDPLVPIEAARHAATLHSLDFRELEGLGHAPQLEEPGRVVDVTAAWLAGPRGADGRMGAWQVSSLSRSGPSSLS